MATYKKRGHKPKNKQEEEIIEEQNSTTAEVFSTLDENASRTEEWVSKNQNYILGAIVAVAVIVLGYLAYAQFVQKPKNIEAANELYYPQQHFDEALQTGANVDSLLNLALNGYGGKYGFLQIIDEYNGTKAANVANYAAGISYLKLQQYQEAIDYLEEFSSDDAILGPLAKGGIGDAFSQLNQPDDALEYYEKAINHNTNDYTTPKYLYKAGTLALQLEQNAKALGYFERIKEEFPKSDEGNNIDALIGMAQN